MDSVPPLEIINEEKEYKVEEITKYRKQGCGIQFFIHWKEYKNEYDQWISETGLTYVKEVIKDYWTRVLSQTYKRKGWTSNQHLESSTDNEKSSYQ